MMLSAAETPVLHGERHLLLSHSCCIIFSDASCVPCNSRRGVTLVKKGVFVDGASLHKMGLLLNIKKFDYLGLFQTLQQRIGTIVPVQDMTAVMTFPDFLDGSATAKAARSVGFETLFGDSHAGEDDRLLIEQIEAFRRTPGHNEEPMEVVLISCDQDYLPVLRKKKVARMKIYIVGTRAYDETGFPLVAKVVFDLCDIKREFMFIDLFAYRNTLVIDGHHLDDLTFFSLRLDSSERNPDKQEALMKAIRDLNAQFPGFTLVRLR